MIKLLMMPPCTRSLHEWAKKIRQQLPMYNIVMPDTMQLARTELATADAVFGWVAPDLLPIAKNCAGFRALPLDLLQDLITQN